MTQMDLLRVDLPSPPKPLLKWIGNKHRFAAGIASMFPPDFNRYPQKGQPLKAAP